MSKERALRRAERLVAAEAVRAARERKERRRAKRRALRRRLAPPGGRFGRTGKLFARRTRAQRAGVAVAVSVALVLIWWLVDPLAARIGLTALVAVATPALVVLILDRRI